MNIFWMNLDEPQPKCWIDDCLCLQMGHFTSLFVSSADTLYFFGDNNFTEWQSLFEHYESPPYLLPHTSGAYSFGIAGVKPDWESLTSPAAL